MKYNIFIKILTFIGSLIVSYLFFYIVFSVMLKKIMPNIDERHAVLFFTMVSYVAADMYKSALE